MAFRIASCGERWLDLAVCVAVLGLGMLRADPVKTAKAESLPQYDAGAAVELSAVVVEVRKSAKDTALTGVSLVVKTESDATLEVYLAPADFFKTFEIVFRKGDRIHIVGSKVKFAGGTIVLAREVRRETATIYLRNRNGQPYWLLVGKASS